MSTTPTRWTKQLKAIVDIVYGSEKPMTADEVYLEARQRLPNISLGTVYRNLNKLVDEGLLSEAPKGNINAFIRHPFSNTTFECERCGKLLCIPFDLRSSEIEAKVGMRINRWSIRFLGICQECEKECT